MRNLDRAVTYVVRPGDHFDLLLPDGTVLNVEQTADDFSIVRANGCVAYTTPTSAYAKTHDSNDRTQTTGRN